MGVADRPHELRAVGSFGRPCARWGTDRWAHFVLVATAAVGSSAPTVGVTAGRIRQRLNHERSPWGFKAGPRQERRIPAWGSMGIASSPDWRWWSPLYPRTCTPTDGHRAGGHPNPDLVIDGEHVSVRDWLLAGNDPATAAAAIGDPARTLERTAACAAGSPRSAAAGRCSSHPCRLAHRQGLLRRRRTSSGVEPLPNVRPDRRAVRSSRSTIE